MSLLIADRLYKTHGTVSISDISLYLDPGEILALIGAPGSGKSTILDVIGGQIHPDRGRIRLGGPGAHDDITRASPRTIFGLGVGRTFQRPAVFASMTVRENIQTAILSAGNQLTRLWRPTRRFHRSRVDLLLHRVSLLDHADRAPADLTPSLLRRLDLTLALAHRPRLLLLDEPSLDLTEPDVLLLKILIRDLATNDGIAILWAESDIHVVLGTADRILTLASPLLASSLPLESRTDD